jgi:hypothetical protein
MDPDRDSESGSNPDPHPCLNVCAADPGCFIPDPNIFSSQIPEPDATLFHLESFIKRGMKNKTPNKLTKQYVLKCREILLSTSSPTCRAVLWIRTHFFRIRIHKLFFSDSDSNSNSDSDTDSDSLTNILTPNFSKRCL